MKVPNAEKAVIERAKLVDYLLDIDHVYGASKARLLVSLGYTVDNWRQLEHDIRTQLLLQDVAVTKATTWGMRYETVAALTGPGGGSVKFRSVWQIDRGTDAPRLITVYPE